MSINFAKGFVPLTLVVSFAIFVAGSFLSGFYVKHFSYSNPDAQNWNAPGYKLFQLLQVRVAAAVNSR